MDELDQSDALTRYDSTGLLPRAGDWRSRWAAARAQTTAPGGAETAIPNDQALLFVLPPELAAVGRLAVAISRQPSCWVVPRPLALQTEPVAAWASLPPADLLPTFAALAEETPHLPALVQEALQPLPAVTAAAHPANNFLAILEHCLGGQGGIDEELLPPEPPPAVAAALEACAPHVTTADNPAKQLALHLHERMPVFFGDGPAANLAQDWATRRLWYAESAAWATTGAELARSHVLARLPRYWPNTAYWVHISLHAGGEAGPSGPTGQPSQQALAEAALRLLQRRRFPTTMAKPPVSVPDCLATLYLLELGEWVALYSACLQNVDPAQRVPHDILFAA